MVTRMNKKIKSVLTKKKLNELILDEKMAADEYKKIYEKFPKYKKFLELSKDEKKHYNYLIKLKKNLYS